MEICNGTRNIRISNFKRMHFCCCSRWWWKKKRKFFMRYYSFRNGAKTYSVPYTLYTSIKWDIVKKHHISAILYVLLVTQPPSRVVGNKVYKNIPDVILVSIINFLQKNSLQNPKEQPLWNCVFLWLRSNSPNAQTL